MITIGIIWFIIESIFIIYLDAIWHGFYLLWHRLSLYSTEPVELEIVTAPFLFF